MICSTRNDDEIRIEASLEIDLRIVWNEHREEKIGKLRLEGMSINYVKISNAQV
jgi:hypothetical protein